MNLLPGDVIAVRDSDFISRAIEEVTHSPYSHVAIACTPTALIEAQGFRKVGDQTVTRYKGIADVYRCDTLSADTRASIVRVVQSRIGQHYDYLLLGVELVRYVFGVVLPWYEHDSVICSTLVADGYRSVGIDPCPGVKFPTPGELAGSTLFRKVGVL